MHAKIHFRHQLIYDIYSFKKNKENIKSKSCQKICDPIILLIIIFFKNTLLPPLLQY